MIEALSVPGVPGNRSRNDGARRFVPLASTVVYTPHTAEDAGKPLLSFEFTATREHPIKALCNQLYLSNANAFNFDVWYPALQHVELGARPVVARSSFVKLSDAQVEAIAHLYEQSGRGRCGNSAASLRPAPPTPNYPHPCTSHPQLPPATPNYPHSAHTPPVSLPTILMARSISTLFPLFP